MGIGMTSLALESGFYPVGIDETDTWWLWPALMRQYNGNGYKATDVFYCPQADEITRWNVAFGSGLPADAGYQNDEVRLRQNRGGGTPSLFSYGYNVWGAFTEQFPNTGLGVYRSHPTHGETKYDAVIMPSNMIALGDSNYNEDLSWSAFIGMYRPGQYPSEIHAGTANLLFADGHVQNMRREELITSPDYTGDDDIIRKWNITNRSNFENDPRGSRPGGRGR
jgi:prepilin-type processing-associated H-X9-DG protein